MLLARSDRVWRELRLRSCFVSLRAHGDADKSLSCLQAAFDGVTPKAAW